MLTIKRKISTRPVVPSPSIVKETLCCPLMSSHFASIILSTTVR